MNTINFQDLINQIEQINASSEKIFFSSKTKEERLIKLLNVYAKEAFASGYLPKRLDAYTNNRNYSDYIDFFSYIFLISIEKFFNYKNELSITLQNNYFKKIEKMSLYFDSKSKVTQDLLFYAIINNDEKLFQFLKQYQLSASFLPENFYQELASYKYSNGQTLIPPKGLKEKINNEYIIDMICGSTIWVYYYYYNFEASHFDYTFYFDRITLEKVFYKVALINKINLDELKSNKEKRTSTPVVASLPTHADIPSTFKATKNYYREENKEKTLPINAKTLPSSIYKKELPKTNFKIDLFKDALIKVKPLPRTLSVIENLSLFTSEKITDKTFNEKKSLLIKQINMLSTFIYENSPLFSHNIGKLQNINQESLILIDLFQEEYFSQDIFNTIDIINLIGVAYPSLIKSYIHVCLTEETQENINASFDKTLNELTQLIVAFKANTLKIIKKSFKEATNEIGGKFSEFEFNFRYNSEKENL